MYLLYISLSSCSLAENSDVNMMDVNNLAVCLGPTFTTIPSITPASATPSPMDDQSEMFAVQRHVNELLAFLITYYTEVFSYGSAIDGPVYQKFLPEESDTPVDPLQVPVAPPLSPQQSPAMHSPAFSTGTPALSGSTHALAETPATPDPNGLSAGSRLFLASDLSSSTILDLPLDFTSSSAPASTVAHFSVATRALRIPSQILRIRISLSPSHLKSSSRRGLMSLIIQLLLHATNLL